MWGSKPSKIFLISQQIQALTFLENQQEKTLLHLNWVHHTIRIKYGVSYEVKVAYLTKGSSKLDQKSLSEEDY